MYVRYINKQGFSVCRGYIVSSAQAQNLMEALYDEQTWKEDRYSFFQLDKQYLKEVTGIFCDGDIQTLFEKNAEKRQALAEALRKDILENGGQTVKDQPCAMLMFDYAGIPSEGYMDEWGMNVPAVQEGERVSTSVLVYPAYKRTLAILEETGYPLSMDKLSVEYIDVFEPVDPQKKDLSMRTCPALRRIFKSFTGGAVPQEPGHLIHTLILLQIPQYSYYQQCFSRIVTFYFFPSA